MSNDPTAGGARDAATGDVRPGGTARRAATGSTRPSGPARAPAAARLVPALFLAGLAVLLPVLVAGEVRVAVAGVEAGVRYKELVRALALAWVALQLVPAGRRALPYRPDPSDLPLALFAAAAAASVALGGGHWGSVRDLLGAIGLGLLGRALFAPPARRWLFPCYLGAAVVLVVAREIAAAPDLFPPQELARYRLVTANANVLGFLFAMTGPLLAAEALAASGWRRALAALAAAVAVAGALVTFSRTAAAGLALGLLVLVLGERRRWQALALAALGLAAFLAVQRPDLWSASRAAGDADRPRIMRTSLSLAAAAPLLGIGFGTNNLEERFPARYEALYGTRVFRYHSANQLVDLLVGTGVVGTALALWWCARLGAVAVRHRRAAAGAARRRATGNLAALVAVATMSLAEPPLYQGKLLPLLFLVLGWVTLRPLDEP